MAFITKKMQFETDFSRYEPKPNTPGKGLEGQNCNVTQCQKPDSAHHFNNVMKAWYCLECAQEIQYFANKDGFSFYDGIEGKLKR